MSALHRDLLGRAADASELASLTDMLKIGSRADVVATLMRSDEYLGRQVDAAYRRYLGRDADPEGRATYVEFLRLGANAKDLASILMGSEEYRGLHPAGEPFVTALYEDVLGRFPDADGLAAHVSDLGRGFCSRARLFLDCDEHHARVVESVYQDLLGRAPGDSALELGMRLLAGGTTLEAFIQLVAAGDEYYSR